MNIRSFILFEDDDLIIVNKPGGLLSIQDGYNADLPCVKNLLDELYSRVWIVHRLDKNTSGILVFAKNQSAHRDLNIQFSNRQIVKEYQACMHGVPLWDQRLIKMPLKINGDRRHRTIPDLKNGKNAVTSFIILKRSRLSCMMKISPKTGLTHQIRTHASLLGFPIIGDNLYWRLGSMNLPNNYQYPYAPDKLYLHAASIEFFHPSTQRRVSFHAPLPEYFNSFPKNIFWEM